MIYKGPNTCADNDERMAVNCLESGFIGKYITQSIDFNTVYTTCPAGVYFLIHPKVWINYEIMDVHCLESGCIRLHIPSDLGKYLGRRGCTTKYIPPLDAV